MPLCRTNNFECVNYQLCQKQGCIVNKVEMKNPSKKYSYSSYDSDESGSEKKKSSDWGVVFFMFLAFVALSEYSADKKSSESSRVQTENRPVQSDSESYLIVIYSKNNKDEAIEITKKLIGLNYNSKVFLSSNGYYFVTIYQTFNHNEAKSVLTKMKDNNEIPQDSYVMPPKQRQLIYPL